MNANWCLDFLSQTEELYKCLDTANTSKVDRDLCEAITSQLHAAVRTADDTPTS